MKIFIKFDEREVTLISNLVEGNSLNLNHDLLNLKFLFEENSNLKRSGPNDIVVMISNHWQAGKLGFDQKDLIPFVLDKTTIKPNELVELRQLHNSESLKDF